MENNHKNNNNTLARWLNNDLTETELKDFEASNDYPMYKKVLDGFSKLNTPEYRQDEAYSDFKNKLLHERDTKGKVVKLSVKQYLAIAASIALLVTVSILSCKTTYSTGFGQQETIILPDNSEIIINAKSNLAYNKFLFWFNRTLTLDGEAFFKVSKGSKFSVITDNGEVNVLGTEFNVISRGDFFETKCYEGKVQVKMPNITDTLVSGEKIRAKDKEVSQLEKLSDNQTPLWITGTSKFKDVPLSFVLKEFEAQFDVSFDTSDLDFINKVYSGSFIHDLVNIESALENVFLPMRIAYEYNESSKTVKLKNLKTIE
ncbi:FecR family protein [Aquimarina sp. RZ0]|uniref:FecR family protein n=1 Tax=Aquimarina sp. RZ0 TaxID=2607730 RepID=UPI0011F37099|nr:FecR family protein [Aquimarina sp. RZ0]KAA1243045.1 anti-sigma factor [Aquimarina sp. RZ0]